jgi:hypothetical protein
MAEAIYILCALTSLACAWLLLHRYRQSGHRLLFWSGLCFVGMTINNAFLVVDKLVFPDIDLLAVRQVSALVSVLLLVYGLIYEKD